jgi:subtilisin family serine protease
VQKVLNGAGAEFHYTFDHLNSFVVTVPEQALAGLTNNPNVVDIEEDVLRYPVVSTLNTDAFAPMLGFDAKKDKGEDIVPYGVDAVQAREIWDQDMDGDVDKKAKAGAGVKVCIIDTGYYGDHEDLPDLPDTAGMSQVDDNWYEDGYGHGSHVAGTIAAQDNGLGVIGVAPNVSFFIVKIFANDGLWVNKAHASDLIEASLTCADNGAKVISMSLSGTNSNFREQSTFDMLYAQGVLSVGAASNDGIEEYHYPASYDSVVSVAAIDEEQVVADFSQYNDQIELAAPGVAVLSTIPYVDETFVTVDGADYQANPIEYAALGTATGAFVDGGGCLTTGDWGGAVVLCERGDISFLEKVMNVQDSGGVAAVIYNNEPGNFFGTLGDEKDSSEIIAVSISQEDGQYLVANYLGYEATVTNNHIWPTSGYEAWDGTSMATPHVSAVAALLWSEVPTATNVEIREAMDATALDLGDEGRDVHYGFGLVQAKAALDYLLAGE